MPEARVLGQTLTPTAHYVIGLALLGLALLAFAVLARRGPGLALAAGRDQVEAALGLGVPVARLRLGAFTTSAAIAGLAGALSVELSQVADPSAYGPVLSFELFVAVILGGARFALGPVVGLAVISGFSNVAEEIGAARGLPPGRLEEMLTGYGMLLVLGLGGAGLLPLRGRLVATGPASPERARAGTPRSARRASTSPAPLAASGVSKRFGSLEALDRLELEVAPGTVHALIGPNGSGKTTALKVIAGQLGADDGSIVLGEEDLTSLPQRERAERGVVGTQQTTAVFPDLTVLENALVGAGLRRRQRGAVPDVLPDAQGAGGRTASRRARARGPCPRRARPGPRPPGVGALRARAAAADDRLRARDRAARAPARRAGRRRLGRRARAPRRPPPRRSATAASACS